MNETETNDWFPLKDFDEAINHHHHLNSVLVSVSTLRYPWSQSLSRHWNYKIPSFWFGLITETASFIVFVSVVILIPGFWQSQSWHWNPGSESKLLVLRVVPGRPFGADYYQKFSDLFILRVNMIFLKFSFRFMWSPNMPLSYTKCYPEVIWSLDCLCIWMPQF